VAQLSGAQSEGWNSENFALSILNVDCAGLLRRIEGVQVLVAVTTTGKCQGPALPQGALLLNKALLGHTLHETGLT
jgi:hypothetical protein